MLKLQQLGLPLGFRSRVVWWEEYLNNNFHHNEEKDKKKKYPRGTNYAKETNY